MNYSKQLLILKNVFELVTLNGSDNKPRIGKAMSDLGIIKNGSLIVSSGIIKWVGESKYLNDNLLDALDETEIQEIDCSRNTVLPGLIDPHTHIVFGGSRENEFAMRCAGKSYGEIALAGGGIKSTVKATRELDNETLMSKAIKHLDRMLEYGTTTIEAKSGYGLSTFHELKILRILRELQNSHPMEIISTFLGAHTVPQDTDKQDYLDLVLNEMIPAVKDEALAEFCDVFCEKGAFSVEESERILLKGKEFGLKPKIHADQLSESGGSQVAARVKAISADHLDYISQDSMNQIKNSGTIAVLLPGCVHFLGLSRYAPARKFIESEIPIALATDLNPGTCYTESLPIIMNIACSHMKMSPEEVITACTINAAHAIDRAKNIGSLEPGKKADITIFDCDSYKMIPYHFGVNLVDKTIKDGVVVYRKS
jgi:imidazolonepropionase